MKQLALLVIIGTSILSCAHYDVFEKTVIIPRKEWYYNNKPSFSFLIKDTLPAYNIFLIIRHTDAYQYNNLWINLGSQIPGDSARYQNVDLRLGNDKNGWEGNGMDDIFELRKKITLSPILFKKAGKYTFTLSQVMRENPLKHILNVGIRVEKVRL